MMETGTSVKLRFTSHDCDCADTTVETVTLYTLRIPNPQTHQHTHPTSPQPDATRLHVLFCGHVCGKQARENAAERARARRLSATAVSRGWVEMCVGGRARAHTHTQQSTFASAHTHIRCCVCSCCWVCVWFGNLLRGGRVVCLSVCVCVVGVAHSIVLCEHSDVCICVKYHS